MRRLSWQVARVLALRDETATARTVELAVPQWAGHRAGQHIDLRLTAEDGYSTQRSYSVSSAAGATPVELTVQTVRGGEVSPYLTQELKVGDDLEVRGPVGGWFVWEAQRPGAVVLIAGGSGIVPLMSMLRTRAAAGSSAPCTLLYSARTPDDVIYADELSRLRGDDSALSIRFVFTRATADDVSGPPRHIDRDDLPAPGTDGAATVYICGPTRFVEAAAHLALDAGHRPRTIRTERFGSRRRHS